MEREPLNRTAILTALHPRVAVDTHDLAYGWGDLLELGNSLEDTVSLSVFPEKHAVKLRSLTDFLHFAKINATDVEDGLVRFHGDTNGISRTLLVTFEGTYMLLREGRDSKFSFGGPRESREESALRLKLHHGDPDYRSRFGTVTGIREMIDRNKKPYWVVLLDNGENVRVFDKDQMQKVKTDTLIETIEEKSRNGFWRVRLLHAVV